MTGIVVALAALLALLAWFFWPSDAAGNAPPPTTRAGVEDEGELEQAEREVQEAPDEHSVRDWGPGASKPPI
jgi:beta-lactam-binding protein with PASTA domain